MPIWSSNRKTAALAALAVGAVMVPGYWQYETVAVASSGSHDEGAITSAQEHTAEPRPDELD
ncbi:hypothetical protein [Amycolatopsis sp. PS_44_ISF1]|uniref:hypothetical protein n=1 Tax=Amycolatopsis sp. PS_44_ISF1 TaxID=2974917 RepID=UPI0028DF93E0|nr:hypothetical protein [Amycolatopsis sp. PS_44_ISF1]MDT8911898.1 hypothetical protein [Amycolatopsis sp. PS_44_ISF1]